MPGLYLHIPFCIKKCRYCDFVSFDDSGARLPGYLRALEQEMVLRAREQDWGVFDTVFIGGGTPSLLSGDQLAALMDALRSRFKLAPGVEISMECNPGTLTPAKCKAYREAGINRLSLGIQSMEDSLLTRIGRIHSAFDAVNALRMIKEAGFSNINVDLMYGLPGQTTLDYLSSLQEVLRLSPTHISAYHLTLEENTPLYRSVQAGEEILPGEDAACVMQELGISYMETYYMRRYEISNYARPGFECGHNLNYWHNGAYLGLGLGAHSAWRLALNGAASWSRWQNPDDFAAYGTAAKTPLSMLPLEHIDKNEEAFECVMLGLRLIDGISLSEFRARFGCGMEEIFPQSVDRLTGENLLIIDKNNQAARLTPRGLDIQNQVLQVFLEEADD